MTLDDARAELLTLADEFDRVVQVVSSQDGESTERQKRRAAALRLVLDALPTREHATTLECPCCGDDGAVADANGEFHDGQRLVCGCNGLVSVDADDVYISIGIDPCPDGALCHEPSTARALGRDTETPR